MTENTPVANTDQGRVEAALISLVRRNGTGVGDDGVRLRDLLETELRRNGGAVPGSEVEALAATARIQLAKAMGRGMTEADAAKGLRDSGMTPELATWVTGLWTRALKVVPDPPAPDPVQLASSAIASTPAQPGLGDSTPLVELVPVTPLRPNVDVPPAVIALPKIEAAPSPERRPSENLAGQSTPSETVGGSRVEPASEVTGPEPSDAAYWSPPSESIDGDEHDSEHEDFNPEEEGTNPRTKVSKSLPSWALPVGALLVVGAVAAFFLFRKSPDTGLKSQAVSIATTNESSAADTVNDSASDSAPSKDSTATSRSTDRETTTAVDGATLPATATTTTATNGGLVSGPTDGGGSIASADQMVSIPQGSYPVGSEKPDLLAESTRRTIELPAYFIDIHEVTNAQYKAFVDKSAAAPPLAGWTARGPSDSELDNPVRAVTFEWAGAYCASLGKRLPTEAEWEVAAGGKDGTKFAWGNDVAVVSLPATGTYPVMSVAGNKSSLGVFDLTGSVWEWVDKPYDANKVGAGKHVLRGGQNGYVRNNWSRLPVDERASNAVLGAGVRCAASLASADAAPGEFRDYERPADPVSPTVTVPAGFKSYDDFSGAKLEWLEVNKPNARFGYHPNKFFHLETKEKSTRIVALCPCTTPAPPFGVVASGEIEPTLTQSDGTFEWGIVVRSDESATPPEVPKQFVALVVDPRNRRWRAYVHRADGTTIDIGQAQFNSDENETIKLELRDLGSKIEYYINDTYRGESPPGVSLPNGNHAGFVLSSDADSTKVHIHYGSFGIRSVS